MGKQKRYLGFVGVFLVVFFCYIIWNEYSVGSMFSIGSYEGYGYSILGGSLSNIYWSLVNLPNFFKEDWTDKIISLTFFSVSSVHVYLSYRLLSYMLQTEVLKWYLWLVWVVNCYIWFFMGSIITLMMRL